MSDVSAIIDTNYVLVTKYLTFPAYIVFWSNTLFRYQTWMSFYPSPVITGDPLCSRAACTQPCNVNTHSRAYCSPGARLWEQWGHGCVNNGARLCASARLCRGSPVSLSLNLSSHFSNFADFRQLQIPNAHTKYYEILAAHSKTPHNKKIRLLLNKGVQLLSNEQF